MGGAIDHVTESLNRRMRLVTLEEERAENRSRLAIRSDSENTRCLTEGVTVEEDKAAATTTTIAAMEAWCTRQAPTMEGDVILLG